MENYSKEMVKNMQQETPAGPEQEMLRFMVSALNLFGCAYKAENTALRNWEHNVK